MKSIPSLLVFPATTDAALDVPELVRDRGEAIVLASSVLDRLETRHGWRAVERLPSIYDPGFEAAFADLAARHNVRRVYCSVASVFAHLSALVESGRVAVTLIGDSPQRRVIDSFQALQLRAKTLFSFAQTCCPGIPAGRFPDLVGMLMLSGQVYGESSDEKLAAFFAMMNTAVDGDVVEIGSLMGRSALALAYLGQRYGVGPVLAVDPWSRESAVQHDSPALIQALPDGWDLEQVFAVFLANLQMVPRGSANYIRGTSVAAAQRYRPGLRLDTELGDTRYCGRIAVIHIDGNHDYAAVRADCAAWLSAMQPWGWVVLDDYVWAHGDGPRRMGDELLASCGPDIEQAFTCGKALFLRLGADVATLHRWAAALGAPK